MCVCVCDFPPPQDFRRFHSALIEEAAAIVGQRSLDHNDRLTIVSVVDSLIRLRRSGRILLQWSEYLDLIDTTTTNEEHEVDIKRLTDVLNSTVHNNRCTFSLFTRNHFTYFDILGFGCF